MTNREHFHLRWNDFDNIVTSAFGTPKIDGDLTDVTLNEKTPQDCYKICYAWNTALGPALRALGLLLADGAPTVGRGKTF